MELADMSPEELAFRVLIQATETDFDRQINLHFHHYSRALGEVWELPVETKGPLVQTITSNHTRLVTAIYRERDGTGETAASPRQAERREQGDPAGRMG